MRLRGRSILCMAALFIMASSLARGADPDWIAPDEQDEMPPETACACDAASLCGGAPLAVFVPDLTPGFRFTGSLLYLRPGADNLGFATITTFLPVQNPQWAVETLNPQYQPGFSVGAQYVFPCSGKDIRANWEHLRTSDAASVAVSDPATQWISPFNQTGPATSESANEVGVFHLKGAQGLVKFDYDMVNIEAGQTLNIGSNTEVRLFTGLSYARLREQLISTFYNDPNINPVPPVIAIPDPTLRSISLDNTSTFTGFGPRLGFGTAHNLSHGFTFVGQLSGAILAGWVQPAQYRFAGVFDDAVDSEKIGSHNVPQVVYTSDAKLGLGYSRLLGSGAIVNIETGFKAAIFINPFSTYETSTNVLPLDIGSLSTNSMRHTPSNFTLNGFYATGSVQW